MGKRSASTGREASPNGTILEEIDDLVRQLVVCLELGGETRLKSGQPPQCEEIILDAEVDGVRYLLVRLHKSTRPVVSLSPREQEIVRMVAQGYPNKMVEGEGWLGAIGNVVGSLLGEQEFEDELEGEGEFETESELEGELSPIRKIYPDAMMEHLGELAAEAETEQEAAEHFLPLIGMAASKLLSIAAKGLAPVAKRALPRIAKAVTRVTPQLTRGIGKIARGLHRQPGAMGYSVVGLILPLFLYHHLGSLAWALPVPGIICLFWAANLFDTNNRENLTKFDMRIHEVEKRIADQKRVVSQ